MRHLTLVLFIFLSATVAIADDYDLQDGDRAVKKHDDHYDIYSRTGKKKGYMEKSNDRFKVYDKRGKVEGYIQLDKEGTWIYKERNK